MSTRIKPASEREIVYPDSDGQPMADNTLQWEWMVTIKGGLDALYRDDPNVFVAGDLLWYPVEGDNKTRMAPDAMVAFGRPKGFRGSYMQWREDGIAPQVVFEVLSPGNRAGKMRRKFEYYERFGVEEYYLYDPDTGELWGWQRSGEQLVAIPQMQGWVSPRLNICFATDGADLVLTAPDGRRFASYVELAARLDAVTQERDAVAQELDRERQQAERLAEQLRRAGIEPDA